MHFCLQVMLLDSSLQLPPLVLVIPSPSDVLLLEMEMESPSGEWVAASECLLSHSTAGIISACGPPGITFTVSTGTGFGTSVTSFSSTLSGTATLALDGTLVECFGPGLARDAGNRVGGSTLQILGK